jgi:hypothetical protein
VSEERATHTLIRDQKTVSRSSQSPGLQKNADGSVDIFFGPHAPYEMLTQLHAALDRVYKLAMSLPDAPLLRFRAETAKLPRTTEAERLVVQRIGQKLFRDALMDYWGGRCPLTGIAEPALLRASHIVPWSDCNDEQRLDVHNGLLLSALWDAAFDQGLVSFGDDGKPCVSPSLGEIARRALAIETAPVLRGLLDAHRVNLAAHRARHGF